MGNSIADSASAFLMSAVESLISIVKLAVQSHKSHISPLMRRGDKLIIMGNGPSLRYAIEHHSDILIGTPLLAVNFAANTPEFFRLRPEFYVLADGVFLEKGSQHPNVVRLHNNLNKVDWPLTLFVPFENTGVIPGNQNRNITVVRFNLIGVDGFQFLCDKAFKSGRGMPRPRNVLIPSLMIALWMGYKEIYLAGADHSWTKTLEVDDTNRVVTIQPHFYEEDEAEKRRVKSVYENVKMHDILESFRIAFHSYFEIKRFAASLGATIYNATPGSFIDAFPRCPLIAAKG